MKNYSIINFCFMIIILFAGCTHKTSNPQPEPEKGLVNLHLHNYIDIFEVDDYNITYTTTTEGRKISLSMGQLYLSDFELKKADGSIYAIPDTIVLKVQEFDVYALANVPAGNYKSIRFKVGLNPIVNKKSPTSYSSGVLNKPEMWFGATAQPDGYIIMNFQGMIDTTTNANGTLSQMQPFLYKIGTDANYKQVTLPDQNFTVVANQSQFFHLLIDYSKLFNGVVLNNKDNLHVNDIGENSSAIATKIVNNIPSMFSYEE